MYTCGPLFSSLSTREGAWQRKQRKQQKRFSWFVCLSFEEEEMVISLSTKEGGTFTYFRVWNPKHFFFASALFFSFVPFSLFAFKIGTTKRMRAFNNKEKEEDLWRKWDDRRALSTWKHPQLVEQSTRFYTPGVNTVRCFVCCCLINYISRFVFFTRTFLTSAKIIVCGFCRIFTDEQKQCFAAFVFLSLSLSPFCVWVCVFIVLFPALARMIPHQNRRRERERHFFRRSS